MDNKKYQLEPFEPNSATPALWDQYLALLEELFIETNPTDPLPSRALWKRSAMDPSSYVNHHRWLILSNSGEGSVVGRGLMTYERDNSPSFSTNGHIVYGWVDISKDHRELNLGSTCLRILATKANELGKTTFQSSVLTDAGRFFCKKFGGEKALEDTYYRLYLDDVHWALIKNWKTTGHDKLKGVSLRAFTEIPDQYLTAYIELLNEVFNQQPLGKLEFRLKITPESHRHQERRLIKQGTICITIISIEADGSLSGLTDRYYHADNPHKIHIGFTGVKAEYRNRGLGKLLKAEMLLHIRQVYPYLQYEVTENENSNAPMRSINKRMGYKAHITKSVYQFKPSELIKQFDM